MKRRSLSMAIVCLFVGGGAAYAAIQADDGKQEQEDPTEGSTDMDAVVSYPMAAVLKAAKQAMEIYGCEIKEEEADYLEGTRSRHIGVFVGSGGEKVKVKLNEKDGGTRVRIETGKGFMGRLGKKNWSRPIFNEMVKILEEESSDSRDR